MFEEEDQELLEFILKNSEIIRFVNSEANSNYRYYGKAMNEGYIVLSNSCIDEMFDILKSREVLFQKEYQEIYTGLQLREILKIGITPRSIICGQSGMNMDLIILMYVYVAFPLVKLYVG